MFRLYSNVEIVLKSGTSNANSVKRSRNASSPEHFFVRPQLPSNKVAAFQLAKENFSSRIFCFIKTYRILTFEANRPRLDRGLAFCLAMACLWPCFFVRVNLYLVL